MRHPLRRLAEPDAADAVRPEHGTVRRRDRRWSLDGLVVRVPDQNDYCRHNGERDNHAAGRQNAER
jgi:hypothetical protein